MWRLPLACAVFILAAVPQPATITGRVFDVYHRPVANARVATMDRKIMGGKEQVVAGTEANVDDAGMYHLSVPPGRYILAVLPPPAAMDHATIFPAYLQDTVDFAKAPPVIVGPGELRPFTDFLLLEVESHRITGQVTGAPKGRVAILLRRSAGYTEPLRAVEADALGRFVFEHIPAGSYDLNAIGPLLGPVSLRPALGAPVYRGAAHIDLAAPEGTGLQIQLQDATR